MWLPSADAGPVRARAAVTVFGFPVDGGAATFIHRASVAPLPAPPPVRASAPVANEDDAPAVLVLHAADGAEAAMLNPLYVDDA